MTLMSFTIPVTSQKRNDTAKFQLDWTSTLAREVEIGEGWTDRQCAMTIPYLEFISLVLA